MKLHASLNLLVLGFVLFSVTAQEPSTTGSPAQTSSSITTRAPQATTINANLSSSTGITNTSQSTDSSKTTKGAVPLVTTSVNVSASTTPDSVASVSTTTEAGGVISNSSSKVTTVSHTSSPIASTSVITTNETVTNTSAQNQTADHTPVTPVTTQPVSTIQNTSMSTSTKAGPTVTNQSTLITTAPSTQATTSAPVTWNTTEVVISETNLLLADSNLFVELKGLPQENLLGLTLVVFDGHTATEKWKQDFGNSSVLSSTGLLQQPIDKKVVQNLTSVVVALYQSKDYNSTVMNNGLQDFVIFTNNPSAEVAAGVKEIMLPQNEPLTVVKSGLMSGNLSLSRCGKGMKNPSLFVVTYASPGQGNRCIKTSNSSLWDLQLHEKSKECNHLELNDVRKQKVENQLIIEVNKRCQCGLTTFLVQSNLTCDKDLFLSFRILESYAGQAERVAAAFTSFVSNTPSFIVGNNEYIVMNCTANCQKHSTIHPPSGNKKGNTTVTVAVVLSCVLVFLIILVAVILYMRGKRRGIIRQFRMTRLQEDDDMDDMDDFIGGGPSFNSSRSNLTR